MIETIAYLGPDGTFTQEATQFLFTNPKAELVPYPTIPDVFLSIEQGISDYGVVPVENTIEGSVNVTIDWLIHHVEQPIVGELIYPIKQCLLVHPKHADRPASDFKQVLSHPQAIAQCQMFLHQRFPKAKLVNMDSTAKAAETLSKRIDQPLLAIGPEQAAKKHGLHIMQTDIQDHENNYTRFIVVGKKPVVFSHKELGYKSSIQVTLASDFPGALHQVLAVFAWRKINLTRIESRPTKTGLGNYFFIIDAEISADHVLMKGALAELEALGCSVRLLGSYPCYVKKLSKKVEL